MCFYRDDRDDKNKTKNKEQAFDLCTTSSGLESDDVVRRKLVVYYWTSYVLKKIYILPRKFKNIY